MKETVVFRRRLKAESCCPWAVATLFIELDKSNISILAKVISDDQQCRPWRQPSKDDDYGATGCPFCGNDAGWSRRRNPGGLLVGYVPVSTSPAGMAMAGSNPKGLVFLGCLPRRNSVAVLSHQRGAILPRVWQRPFYPVWKHCKTERSLS